MPGLNLDYLVSYHGKQEDLTDKLFTAAVVVEDILGWKHALGRGGNASKLVAHLGNGE